MTPSARIQRQIDALLDQAEEAIRERDWSAAIECTRAVLKVDPANEDALSFQGMAESARNQMPASGVTGGSSSDLSSLTELSDSEQIVAMRKESIRNARESGPDPAQAPDSPRARPGASPPGMQKTRSVILDALADDRFQLFRQPIVSVADNTIALHEVLIRMINEDGSLRSPAEFIPEAESLNLIQQIDRWVIAHSMQTWRSRHDAGQALHLAVNVSGMSVGEEMAEYLREQADLNNVPRDAITLEITETAAIQEDSLAGEMAEALHRDGFKLAIDNFGSDAISLAKVRELKFEYLKLDGILVKNLAESESDREFVSVLAGLIHEIGVEIIAEFVQNQATMEFLAECEIEYAQGYYLGVPEPFPD